IPAYTGCGFETECAAARQTNTMNFRSYMQRIKCVNFLSSRRRTTYIHAGDRAALEENGSAACNCFVIRHMADAYARDVCETLHVMIDKTRGPLNHCWMS